VSNGIRIGVVGVNFGAVVQLPGLQSEGYEVVAVCASRKERAEAAAQKFNITNAFTDFEAMLKMPGLDAVSIVTGPMLHHSMGLAALMAGKHVLLEKPFAVNVREAWELLAESKKRPGQAAMIDHEFRYTPPRRFIKELIAGGFIGNLNTAVMTLLMGARVGPAAARPLPWSPGQDLEQGGGVHKALGSHYIDCLRDWLGDISGVSGYLETFFPDRIEPFTGRVRKVTGDDAFGFTVTFQRGGWATMAATFAAPFGPGARIELYGSQGALVTHQTGPNPTNADKVMGAQVGAAGLAEMPLSPHVQAPADERDHRLPAFRLLVRQFAQGIKEGRSPEPNFLDGFRCQQVLDGIVESHQTGRSVKIDLSPV
jgi:predicted dehydrogenase